MKLGLRKRNLFTYLPLYFVFLSSIVLGIRDYSEIESSPISVEVIHKIIFMSLAFFLIFMYLSLRRKLFVKLQLPLLLYFIYILLAIFSLIQSKLLEYSGWKIFEISTTFFLAIYIMGTSKNQANLAIKWYETTLKIIFFIVALAIVGLIISPSNALKPPTSIGEAFLNYQLIGYIINTNPNSLGMLSAILLIVSICRLSLSPHQFSRKYWGMIAISAFFVMVLAQSRTSWIAIGIAMILFILLSPIKIQYRIFLTTLICIIWYFGAQIFTAYFQRGSPHSLIVNLSGRTEYWTFAWDIIKENKFIGSGFGEGPRVILSTYGAGTASTLHSDYFDSAASVGIAGGLLIFCVFASSILYLFKNRYSIFVAYSKSYWMEFLLITLMLWIRSFTGTCIAIFNYFLIIFMVIMAVVTVGFKRNLKLILS